MIQVCDPPRQRQVRRLSAEEFFTLVRCGGAGFYRPCSEVLRMLTAGEAWGTAGAALLVLPMMCTVFMVATSQASFYIPMSGGLALFLPVCFWLLDSSREGKTACDAFRKCWNNAEKALILLTAAAVVYGSVFMSAVDQQAMYEGRQATKELSDLIAQTLVNEG